MGYWKSNIVPMFKWVFDRNSAKNTAVAEACKSFEASKDSYDKLFEENKDELQPKVLEIYEVASEDIKIFIKERTEEGLKQNSAELQIFLEELVKIEFPGSEAACDACSKFGAEHVVAPIVFVFDKVSTLVMTEEETSGNERVVIEEGTKEEAEEKKEGAEEVTEKTEEIAKDATAAAAPTQEEEKPAEPATAGVPPTQEEEKPAEPATGVAPTQEEEKPAEPAIGVAPTQGEEKSAEPALAVAPTQKEEKKKPDESVMASTSDEHAKKIEQEASAGPAIMEPAKV